MVDVPDILAALAGAIIGYTIGVLLAWGALGWSGSDIRAGGVGFLGLLLGAAGGLIIWRVATGGPVEPLIEELISPLIGFLVGVAGALILGPAGVPRGARPRPLSSLGMTIKRRCRPTRFA